MLPIIKFPTRLFCIFLINLPEGEAKNSDAIFISSHGFPTPIMFLELSMSALLSLGVWSNALSIIVFIILLAGIVVSTNLFIEDKKLKADFTACIDGIASANLCC